MDETISVGEIARSKILTVWHHRFYPEATFRNTRTSVSV